MILYQLSERFYCHCLFLSFISYPKAAYLLLFSLFTQAITFIMSLILAIPTFCCLLVLNKTISIIVWSPEKNIIHLKYSNALIYLYTITFDNCDPLNLTNTEIATHKSLPHVSFYTRGCYLLVYFFICCLFFAI